MDFKDYQSCLEEFVLKREKNVSFQTVYSCTTNVLTNFTHQHCKYVFFSEWFYVCFYSSDAEMRSAFRSADKNKSGKLDAYELRDFLKKQKNVVSMDLCTKWIRQNDKNGDQKLDYEEFLKFVQSML